MTKFPDLIQGQDEAKWLYFLKHGHEMSPDEVAELGVAEIIEAERKLRMISQDRALRIEYERRHKAQMDAGALRRDSWVEGHDAGLDEGKRLGLDEGKRLGLDEGKRLGLKQAAVDLCEVLGLSLTAEQAAWLDAQDEAGLSALCQHLKTRRCWPA